MAGKKNLQLVEEIQAFKTDPTKLRALGQRLNDRFTQYEMNRRLAEIRWLTNLRQFLGVYDPEIQVRLEPSQSHAYPRITRVKCVSMVSRLMNLLFPSADKNWSLRASENPHLPQEYLQQILDEVQMQMQQAGPDFDLQDAVDKLVTQEAEARAKKLTKIILGQLSQIGGSKSLDYQTMCRHVIQSGVIFSCGVLGGPYVKTRKQSFWKIDQKERKLVAQEKTIEVPTFEFVPIWDYYPDMTAKSWDQMDGQFQRYVMSRHQVKLLTKRPDFMAMEINKYLEENQTGNYRRRTYETELKALGVQNNVNDQEGSKYELYKWEGFLYAADIAGVIDVPQNRMADSIPCTVWIIDGHVIKADLNPWYRITNDLTVNMYHQFVFEADDTNIFGNGLPNIMRDSQMSVALAARMALDNASAVCGPQVELDLKLLREDQDLESIHAFKIWYRDEENDISMSNAPAIRSIQIESHLNELMSIMQIFMKFSDMETFVTSTNDGITNGPSEPYRTASGASLLKADSALPFKDIVRNFDGFTESVISAIVRFNQHFSLDKSLHGDFETVARGAMSLVAKEVRGYELDNYVATMPPEEKQYVNWYEMAVERARSRDLPVDRIFVDEETAGQIQAAAAQSAQIQEESQDDLVRASVVKVLADAHLSLEQAGDANAQQSTQYINQLLTAIKQQEASLQQPQQGQLPNEAI